MPKEFNLALVTGATSGIGREVTHLLLSKGISVIVTGRNIQQLADFQKKSDKVEIFAADLGNLDERKALIDLIHLRKPDLVINNAGFGLYGLAHDLSTEEQRSIVEVNCVALQDLTLESAKSMLASKQKGVILNVSSAASFQVFPYFAVYAASKAFVTSLSQSLDYELKSEGVRVLVACPGQVATSFSSRASGKTRDRSKDSAVMTVEYAAHALWRQIEQAKPLVIFDWKYNLLTRLSTFLPTAWIAPILKKIMQKRKQS